MPFFSKRMGNSGGKNSLIVKLKSGDVKHLPETTTICVIIHGERGQSDVIRFENIGQFRPADDGFMRYTINTVKLESAVQFFEFWAESDGNLKFDWFIEKIDLNDRKDRNLFSFPVGRWLIPGFHYVITNFEALLPQYSRCIEVRDAELALLRDLYVYDRYDDKLPPRIQSIPDFARFTDSLEEEFSQFKHDLFESCQWLQVVADDSTDWSRVEDFEEFYRDDSGIPIPWGVIDWTKDVKFGHQRLCGPNPVALRAISELPENLAVTEDMLNPFFEGWRLDHVLNAGRLYVVDLAILEGLTTAVGYPFPAPVALFYRDGEKNLMPIAIQLFQKPGPNNPVFMPTDPPYTWLLAKMWFNLADATYSLAVNYFGRTHLMLEGIAIAIHRCFSPSHPIYKLLVPHFKDIFSVNRNVTTQLLEEDSFVDRNTSLGLHSFIKLIKRGISSWRFDVDGMLPANMFKRGIYEPNTLGQYCFSQDALALYSMVERYVRSVVANYYRDWSSVQHDRELQAFVRMLMDRKRNGGLHLDGLPNDGNVRRPDDVMQLATVLLFEATVSYSLYKNLLYDYYAFPPCYPLMLRGQPPDEKREYDEMDVLSCLPPRSVVMQTIVTMKCLSPGVPVPFGHFPITYLWDPVCRKAADELSGQLRSMEETLVQEADKRLYPFTYLNPSSLSNHPYI